MARSSLSKAELAALLMLGGIFVALFVLPSPAQLVDRSGKASVDSFSTPLTWGLHESRYIDGEKIFNVKFADGRLWSFTANAAHVGKYYPERWARELGIGNPFIELTVGANTTRIDIHGDADGEQLVRDFFSVGKPLVTSPNYQEQDNAQN